MIKEIEKILIESIDKKFNLKLDWLKIWVSPKNMFWDYSFNGGVLARDLKKNPALIIEELREFLEDNKNWLIEWMEVTWAYLNIKVNNNIYTELFNKLYKNKDNLIDKNISHNKSIVIDYIWANVWKPLHIGHMCTPNQWQVLINLYRKLGYNVIADSHIGDWGIIFWKLILAYKLWWDESKLEEEAINYLLELYIKITEETEKNPDLEQKTRDEFKLLSEGNSESVELWKKFTSFSISAMQVQLDRLNVKPDYNIWESFYEWLWLPKMEDYPDLNDDMHSIVDELIKKWIAVKNDDNSVWVNFDEELKIPSCILQKRDWTHGYLASDLAAIKYRVQNWSPEKIV
jgi:arginyl-tRNA synthetase